MIATQESASAAPATRCALRCCGGPKTERAIHVAPCPVRVDGDADFPDWDEGASINVPRLKADDRGT